MRRSRSDSRPEWPYGRSDVQGLSPRCAVLDCYLRQGMDPPEAARPETAGSRSVGIRAVITGNEFDGLLTAGHESSLSARHGFTGAATAGARPINGYLRQGMKASRVAWAPGLGPVEWAQANRQLPW